jgi:aminopeptidase-like protein
MFEWAVELFPHCRSITGPGLRTTLNYFQNIVPELQIHGIASGTQVFDWVVPQEWRIKSAKLTDPNGDVVADFADSNLHVVNYAVSVDRKLSLSELQAHLYSREDMPEAIPYVTSYYSPHWGFCLEHSKRSALPDGEYQAFIDSEHVDGELNFADLVIPGESDQEILFTSYACHPSMANNELSGPVVLIALARWVQSLDRRKYTYRFVLAPETIGAIAYLSQNLNHLQAHVIAGYVITCVGDDGGYAYLPSRTGTTLADEVAIAALEGRDLDFTRYSFLDRGSDERQYCSPKVDLPMASLLRSKYGTYPEYHTSLDNLDFISAKGLGESLSMYQDCIRILEHNEIYECVEKCEPQLGRRNLRPPQNSAGAGQPTLSEIQSNTSNILAYADGKTDVVGLSRVTGISVFDIIDGCALLKSNQLLEIAAID